MGVNEREEEGPSVNLLGLRNWKTTDELVVLLKELEKLLPRGWNVMQLVECFVVLHTWSPGFNP